MKLELLFAGFYYKSIVAILFCYFWQSGHVTPPSGVALHYFTRISSAQIGS